MTFCFAREMWDMWKETFRERKNMMVVMVAFEYFLCVCFSLIFTKKNGFHYWPVDSRGNKHENHPFHLQGHPRPLRSLPEGYCLLVTATILHSIFYCPRSTCCQASMGFLAATVHRFWTITFTGVSLLERVSNSRPWLLSNPKDALIFDSLSSIYDTVTRREKMLNRYLRNK